MEEVIPCCACENPTRIDPVIPIEEFIYCRPILTENEISATDCRPEKHNLEPLKVQKVQSQICQNPRLNP